MTTTLLIGAQAMAASIGNSCTLNNESGIITGKNIDTPYTLASVSKVFTTYWATKVRGLDYRYPTQIYITDLGNEIYDVHLRGSVYPYFDKSMFYFLISELNKRGVKKINNLTYDENFEYASVIRTNDELRERYNDQSESEIMRALRTDVKNLPRHYGAFKVQAKKVLKNIELSQSAQLSVKDIHAQSMNIFNPSATTSNFILYSAPMHKILKEMNRNSHNFAANKIYEVLSRTGSFSDFMVKNLNVSTNDFSFYNGSGYPEMVSDHKAYNKATCRVVAKVTQDLFKATKEQSTAEKVYGLRDVLAVAGRDAELDGDSTVSLAYSSATTNGSLVAKTGTVDNLIALGGAVLTNDALVFFHIGVNNNNSHQDKAKSKALIRKFLDTTIEQNGGKKQISDYTPTAFAPFDELSIK